MVETNSRNKVTEIETHVRINQKRKRRQCEKHSKKNDNETGKTEKIPKQRLRNGEKQRKRPK